MKIITVLYCQCLEEFFFALHTLLQHAQKSWNSPDLTKGPRSQLNELINLNTNWLNKRGVNLSLEPNDSLIHAVWHTCSIANMTLSTNHMFLEDFLTTVTFMKKAESDL